MRNILISVIIPVYKAEKYLNKCIDSVLNQTFKNFELILVDDGSPDNSGAICDEYAKKDSRIKVVHKQNGGSSSARNAGIKVAQGEFINFIDSDDTIPNDSLENLIKVQKENDADFVCGVLESSYSNNAIQKIPFINKYFDLHEIIDADSEIFLSKHFRGPCTKLFRRSILQEEHLFFNEDILYGEDTIFVYEYLSKCKKVQCANIVVYNYLRNEESLSTRAFEYFYWYMIKIACAQIGFYNILRVDKKLITCYNTYAILVVMGYAFNHHFTHFNYKKAEKALTEMYNYFNCYFENKSKVVADYICNKKNTDLINAYKLLTSKNGLKKYCKYKLKQKRINNFKVRLKKIRLINDLNNFIKGRK